MHIAAQNPNLSRIYIRIICRKEIDMRWYEKAVVVAFGLYVAVGIGMIVMALCQLCNVGSLMALTIVASIFAGMTAVWVFGYIIHDIIRG